MAARKKVVPRVPGSNEVDLISGSKTDLTGERQGGATKNQVAQNYGRALHERYDYSSFITQFSDVNYVGNLLTMLAQIRENCNPTV